MTSTNTQADAIVATLTDLVTSLVTEDGMTDEQRVQVANAYQAVHVSRRGQVQAQVLKSAMRTDGFNLDTLDSIVETFENVATIATGGTRKVTEEAPEVSAAIVLAGIHLAISTLTDGDDSTAAYGAAMLLQGLGEDSTNDRCLAIAQRVLTALVTPEKGTRKSFSDTLATLIERGDVAEGDELHDADGNVATIVSATEIEVEGDTYESLSVAAQAVTGHSTNGWAHWMTSDDVAIGTLRQA